MLLLKLRHEILQFNPYLLKDSMNEAKIVGVPTDIKDVACLRYLSTAIYLDDLDDNSTRSGDELRHYIYQFCQYVSDKFGTIYLNRRPNYGELEKLADEYTDAGVSGCVCGCCVIL